VTKREFPVQSLADELSEPEVSDLLFETIAARTLAARDFPIVNSDALRFEPLAGRPGHFARVRTDGDAALERLECLEP
jgi:hypothetical protein